MVPAFKPFMVGMVVEEVEIISLTIQPPRETEPPLVEDA
jgi:hypothetical protein